MDRVIAIAVPLDLVERILLGPECHCYMNGRHPDGRHADVCAWGQLWGLYEAAHA